MAKKNKTRRKRGGSGLSSRGSNNSTKKMFDKLLKKNKLINDINFLKNSIDLTRKYLQDAKNQNSKLAKDKREQNPINGRERINVSIFTSQITLDSLELEKKEEELNNFDTTYPL